MLNWCQSSSKVFKIVVLIFLGFWKKIDVYREQPDIHYEYELVLLLETDSGNLGWSTFHGYNELMQEQARVPTLKVNNVS